MSFEQTGQLRRVPTQISGQLHCVYVHVHSNKNLKGFFIQAWQRMHLPAKQNQHKSKSSIAISEILYHASIAGFIYTFWRNECDPRSPQLAKYAGNKCHTSRTFKFKTGLANGVCTV